MLPEPVDSHLHLMCDLVILSLFQLYAICNCFGVCMSVAVFLSRLLRWLPARCGFSGRTHRRHVVALLATRARARAALPGHLLRRVGRTRQSGNCLQGRASRAQKCQRLHQRNVGIGIRSAGLVDHRKFISLAMATQNDSTIFNGFRWENRFRPLRRQHFINPLLYVEYENVNEADKSFLEVVGHHTLQDLQVNNALLRRDTEHSMELKLILSSDFKGWNISENMIAEKNLNNEPWEFGYALGTYRLLSSKASPKPCVFCRQNISAGAELYGGLGDRYSFGVKGTAQYLGPIVSLEVPRGPTLTFEP